MVAYRALGLLPEGSGYAETLRGFGFADGCVVLVAVGEAGSGILGTITLEPFGPANELAQDETEADVRAFAVAPQAQGQGVGRKLLLAVIECAGKRGVCRLRLCSQSAMKAAQHLYTRTGFSRTPDLDFEPVPGITLRAYELALPSNPFSGQQPDKQPGSLSLALRRDGACLQAGPRRVPVRAGPAGARPAPHAHGRCPPLGPARRRRPWAAHRLHRTRRRRCPRTVGHVRPRRPGPGCPRRKPAHQGVAKSSATAATRDRGPHSDGKPTCRDPVRSPPVTTSPTVA